MKKHLLVLAMMLLPLYALADAVEIDGIYYNLIEKTKQAEVTSNPNMYTGDVTIPEQVTFDEVNYEVNRIGNSAFANCKKLAKISIPKSVTIIGENAFLQCSGLGSVHISDLTVWCNIKFATGTSNPLNNAHHLYLNDVEIKDLIIPDVITSINDYTFTGCSGLSSVTIHKGVKSISEYSFSGCSGLQSVYISDLAAWCNINFAIPLSNPLNYAHHLYLKDVEIKELIIPDEITSISNYAFYGCSGLSSVSIPNSVTSIGSGVFYECSGLTSVTFPNSITTIGSSAFRNCSSLTSVTIPNSVTFIGGCAFEGCSGLTSVTISNSISSIEEYVFSGCSCLTSVTIPNKVTSIGNYAFENCIRLTSVTIPNSVSSIGVFAFKSCSGLTNVTIPNSVTSINSYAFFGCSGLTSVSIPNSVKELSNNVFDGCSGLTSVSIPNSVTKIGENAFGGCSGLTSITIPISVTSIGIRAFRECSGLTSITIPNSLTTIEVGTFQECSGLTAVSIPNSVTTIKEDAFWSCSSLSSVTIPNSVTYIGNSGFYDCSELSTVTIGSNVYYIGSSAFASCKKITDVYCYAEDIAYTTNADVFKDSYIEYATLHVPAEYINGYKKTEPWKNFKSIVAIDGETPPGPETKKCATPTISYDNLKLTYSCETEGAECVATISDSDIKTHYGNKTNLSATYEISVYATKSGYDNSDVATATLVFTNATFTTEGTSSAKSANVNPVLIQTNNGIITVEGADDGERIHVYTPAGSQEGSAISQNRLATINTHIKPGDIAIIKIGSRAVKVVMK